MVTLQDALLTKIDRSVWSKEKLDELQVHNKSFEWNMYTTRG